MTDDNEIKEIPKNKKESDSFSKTVEKQKKWWEKWPTRLALVISLLTIIFMLLDIPKKGKEFWQTIAGKPPVTTPLKGIVTDSLNNKPISGAIVKLDKLPGDSVITSSDGTFKFNKVPGKVGDDVRLYINASGYKPRNEYKVLPGPVDIKLKKNK